MRLSLFAPIDRRFAPAPDPKKVGWIGGHAYAHRGLHGPGVPENSPSAFAAAIARGLGIECDVQRSGDGKAMVFHDWELDRLTGSVARLRRAVPGNSGGSGLRAATTPSPACGSCSIRLRGKCRC